VSDDPVMQMLGFGKVMGPVLPKAVEPEVKAEVVFSRDVIIEALKDYIADDADDEISLAADAILKALAEKHLHIFKSKGSEL
jgi:hypothetical protein